MTNLAMELAIIKIGGSLITNKAKPFTLNDKNLQVIVNEIAIIKKNIPNLRLILINGNGSFGHNTAHQFGTHHGFQDEQGRLGFCYLQKDTAQLNRILVNQLIEHDVSAISFAPGNLFWAENQQYFHQDLPILENYLARNFVPVLYGEAILDLKLNCTTISSDVILYLLARYFAHHQKFKINKIINAGNYPGVLDDQQQIIPKIDYHNFTEIKKYFYKSQQTDISGEMETKVRELLKIAKLNLQTIIIDGSKTGNLQKVLSNQEFVGTVVAK
ncbi:MAG: hypothetical protein F6K14_13430 [Symploca sp. SIO2C1]|nr:hypothetical protein [Symploca sp. SIO2C1]